MASDHLEGDDLRPEAIPPSLPKPTSIENYTDDRLREALHFATTRLSRRSPFLMPRANRALLEYQDALTQALRPTTAKKRLKRVEKVQKLEDYLSTDPYSVGEQTEEGVAEYGEEILRIREAVYFARYGTVVAETPAVEQHAPGDALCTAEMWATLKRERKNAAVPGGYRMDGELDAWFKGPYGRQIGRACAQMGISHALILKAAERFAADRDTAVGNNLNDLDDVILEGNWLVFRQTIQRDLDELPMTLHPSRQDDLELILAAIERYRDHYFDIGAHGRPDLVFTWKLTAAAHAVHEEMLNEKLLRKDST